MNVQMRWLFLGALLCGCQPKEQIGENGPDASMLTGDGGSGGDGGTDATPNACACDQSSCGSSVCGHSECGYPCGDCGAGESCFLGPLGCNPTGTPCIDAFGDRIGPVNAGFRTCPTDATKYQYCMCNGGGANDWVSCDATCIDICTTVPPIVPGVTCGTSACGSGVCCIPFVNTSSGTCSSGACDAFSFTRECDGPEDCAGGSVCCGSEDDQWTTTCTPGAACGMTEQFCHTGADCPSSKPHCCEDAQVDDMRTCSATSAPTCT
jgi:hypothetical protein